MFRAVPLGKNRQKFKLAILIPERNFDLAKIHTYYTDYLVSKGHSLDDMMVITLTFNDQGKAPVKLIKQHLEKVKKITYMYSVEHMLVADGSYFKVLAKQAKVEPHYGYVLDSIFPNVKVTPTVNYVQLYYNPNVGKRLQMTLKALHRSMANKQGLFDDNVLEDPVYVAQPEDLKPELKRLLQEPVLACDIETYSLELNKAHLASIAFARSSVTGTAALLDHGSPIIPGASPADSWRRTLFRRQLKQFFKNYQGKLIFHNATFDVPILVWEVFMSHPQDIAGMLEGLDVLFRDLDDTKILAYIATNSTAGNSLSLKDLAFEHAGNYALGDITNVKDIPPTELLEYNLIDAVSTFWVHEKYKPLVEQDHKALYEELFVPALKVLCQTQLVGMPLNMGEVLSLDLQLEKLATQYRDKIDNSPLVLTFNDKLREYMAEGANKKLKKLRKTADDFIDETFNPKSGNHLRMLLFDHLELPVKRLTPTGLPKTDDKALKQLLNMQLDSEIRDLIENLRELAHIEKISSTFIPAFKNRSIKKNGWFYLHGGFNLGGTKSGRLSSSKPNLQQIPSNASYATEIKQCFQLPPPDGDLGQVMVGADFSSLEDRISALQSKDPNKIKVYADGYDGHCLRAFSYFGNQMPDIDPDSVKSINSIEHKYPGLRQLSKGPTFALQYMGTWRTLVENFGLSEDMAKQIEDNYHELYKVADDWAADKVRQAQLKGYMELAFGLRLYTPILPRVILSDKRRLPQFSHKEIKTAVNALGQSYGLLNTRAANEFMHRVWHSKWREKILPIGQIHDSQYYIVEASPECLKWTNDNLIECMQWNQLPEIQHPTVGLEAQLEIYWPSWADKVKLPNKATTDTIVQIFREHRKSLN